MRIDKPRELIDVEGCRETLAEALQLTQEILAPARIVHSFLEIARVQAQIRDIESRDRTFTLAIQVAEETQDTEEKDAALKDIIQGQAQLGNVNGAIQTAGHTQNVALKDYALGQVALALVKAGNIKGALRVARYAQNTSEKASVLASIARMQAESGVMASSLETLSNALQTWNDSPDTEGKDYILRDIGVLQAKAGDLIGAVYAAELILSPEYKTEIQGAIVEAQVKIGDIVNARQTADYIINGQGKDNALASVAKAQAATGDFLSALQTTDSIQADYIQVSALEDIARLQYEDIPGCRETLRKASRIAGGITTAGERHFHNAMPKIGVLTEIARLQARMDDEAGSQDTFQATIQTADALQDHYERAYHLIPIAWAYTYISNWEGVRSILASISEIVPNIQDVSGKANILSGMAEAQERAGLEQESRETLEGLFQHADSTPDPKQESSILMHIAISYLRIGNHKAAYHTAQQIAISEDKVWPLTKIARAQAKAGNMSDSQKTLRDAHQAAQTIQDIGRKVGFLIQIAKLQASRIKS